MVSAYGTSSSNAYAYALGNSNDSIANPMSGPTTTSVFPPNGDTSIQFGDTSLQPIGVSFANFDWSNLPTELPRLLETLAKYFFSIMQQLQQLQNGVSELRQTTWELRQSRFGATSDGISINANTSDIFSQNAYGAGSSDRTTYREPFATFGITSGNY